MDRRMLGGLVLATWVASGCVVTQSDSPGAPAMTEDGGRGGEGGEPLGAAGQSQAGADNGGAAGQAGADAGGEPPECTSNAECIDEHFGQPYVCRRGACVNLKSAACPVVLGAGGGDHEYLRQPAPILVGAYSNFEPLSTVAKSAYNYELAFEELNREAGGLPGGPDGTLRPLVAVVCSSHDDHVRPSIDHLVDDLGVPAILASLPADKLATAFAVAHQEKGANVFFLSPFQADESLRALNDDGLLWHMLGSTRDLADPFAALVTRAEAFQNALRSAPTEPLDVLLIESDFGPNLELAELTTRSIAFNGAGAVASENADHFTRVQIESGLTSTTPDVNAAVAALDPNDPPQIVIALTTRELFEGVIKPFEQAFDEALNEPRPIYLLSPLLADEAAVLRLANDPELPTLRDRLVGVSFAPLDSTLYDQYLARLLASFPEATLQLESTENYYDAAYFLMLSFAAAGDLASYDGFDVLDGMKKLVREDVVTEPCMATNECFEVDPTMVNGAVAYLRSSTVDPRGIALVGTMGPPSFDLTSGVRRTAVSAWCVDDAASGGTEFVPDMLAFDPVAGELVGTFACFPGF